MDHEDERTVAELIVAAEELAARSGTLTARLAGVTHTRSDNGVTVTVDLNGKLVGLDLDDRAMRMRAAELAAEIKRVTEDAAVAVLADGMAVLTRHPLTATVPEADLVATSSSRAL